MEYANREELEELCLLMTDRHTLLGQVFATDHEMQKTCQSFLCREGYTSTACDGFETVAPTRPH